MEVVKALSAIGNVDNIQKDNVVFKLHYRFTVMLLLVFSVLVTTKQYFGDPIKCDTTSGSKDLQSTVETFCWIYGTYTLSDFHSKYSDVNILFVTVQFVSIDTEAPGLGNEVGREQTWHLYYQWVAVVLLLQAFFFYIPFYLWNMWEEGRIKKLVENLGKNLLFFFIKTFFIQN